MSRQSDDLVILEAVINELREVVRRMDRFDEVKNYRVHTARAHVVIAIAELQVRAGQGNEPVLGDRSRPHP
jgi:hypothetical protein